MTEYERLMERYIGGGRGAWYFQMTVGEHDLSGGQFYRKSDARISLNRQLKDLIRDFSVRKEYLELRARDGSGNQL
jgi:hypothetical protein